MRSTIFNFHKYAKLSCLLLLVFLAACAPPPSSGGGGGGGGGSTPNPTPSNVIGVAGGVFTSPQGYRVEIPTGALSQTITLTVTPFDASSLPGASPTGGQAVVCVEFSPDGTVFNVPIIIIVPLASPLTPGELFTIYVYNDTADIWEDSGFSGTVASDGLSVRAEIEHFSIFAVFEELPDTTPPFTSGHSPVPGLTTAAPDTDIIAHIQDADTGVDESTILMTVNGTQVTPTITGAPSDFTLTYTPTTSFNYSEVVNITVNASDLSSNPMAEDAYSFTIIAQPDTTPPTLSNQNPAADAINIALNSDIYFELDDVGTGVDTSELNVTIEGSPAITAGVFQAGFSGTIASDGSAGFDVTINPLNDFNYGQEVNLVVGAADSSNNTMTSVIFKFTCIDDTTAPSTTGHDPAKNATDVEPDSNIIVLVQDAMSGVDESSIAMTVNGSPVTPLITGTAASYTLTYDPSNNFNYDEVVSVSITATDLNSNPMNADSYSFTIIAQPDTTPPTVSNQNPIPDSSGIVRSSDIYFEIDDAGDGVAMDSLNVSVNSSPAITAGVFQTGFSGTIASDGSAGFDVTINPDTGFQYSQVVSVIINASDNSSNSDQFSYNFTCEVQPPETVSDPDLPDGTTSGLINTSYDFTVSGSLSSYSDALEYQFDWGNGTSSIWQDSGSTWSGSWDTTGTFQVKAKARCKAHPVTESGWSPDLAVTISLPPDVTAPNTSGHLPAKVATDVTPDTNIVVHVLDAGDGVDQSSIVMTVNGSPVTPLITGTGADYTVTYNPPSDFSYDAVVNVSIDATDLADTPNAMPTDSYSFTIMSAPDLTAPTLNSLSPADGATKIIVATNIYFEIDDSDSGVDLNSINVTIAGSNAITNGSMQSGFSGSIVSDGSGGYDITINPTGTFSYLQIVNVVIEADDLAGSPNSLVAVNASFTCDYGGWASTDGLTFERSNHTATKLMNGQVLVTGGQGAGSYRSSCEIFDPATDTWDTTGSLSAARSLHTSTLLPDGQVFVTGGENNTDGTLSSCEIYDPGTGNWTTVNSMTQVRRGHSATLLVDGRVLVAGGWDNATSFSTFEIYNPATDVWTPAPLSNMQNGRDGHTATLANNGQVIAVAGWGILSAIKNCESFSLSSGWSSVASINRERYLHTATLLINGDILVAGGLDSSALKSVELFDVSTGWSVKANMNVARDTHTATLLADGNVLCVGGWNHVDGHLASSEFNDSVGGSSWSMLTETMVNARSSHTTTLLDDKRIFVVGGYNGSQSLTSCEIFSYNVPVDNTAPEVVYLSPDNGDTLVASNANIYLTIIDPVNADETFSGADIDSVDITVAGSSAITGGVFDTGFNGSIIQNDNGGILIEINRDADYTASQNVAVTVNASDLALTPNNMIQVNYSFDCE